MVGPLLFAESGTTELVAVGGPVIAALTTAVVYLYHREIKCRKEVAHLNKKVASGAADVVTLTVLVEQMQWSGDLALHGEVTVNARTGLVETWSPAATAILGWSRNDMQGKPLVKIIPERFREKHRNAVERLLTTGSAPKSGPFEQIATKKNGEETWIQTTYSGWHDMNSGEYIVGAIFKLWTRPKPDSDTKKTDEATVAK